MKPRRARLVACLLALSLLAGGCRSTIPITFNGTEIGPGTTKSSDLTRDEKIGVVVVLCAAVALLWLGYETAKD